MVRIGKFAFEGSRIESITFPTSLERIEQNAFAWCWRLTSISLPDNITYIGTWAFAMCTSLASITFGASIPTLFHYPFSGTGNLRSLIFNTPTITPFITPLTLPEHNLIRRITNINLGDSVSEIDSLGFADYINLPSIFIPLNVTTIKENAFLNCPNLTIYVQASSQPIGWHANWNPDDRPVIWGYTNINGNEIDNFKYELIGNYPNPFNPDTTISFSIGADGSSLVTIEIFNIKGQLVKILVNDKYEPGQHTVMWNGKDDRNNLVVSGIYFYRMKTNDFQEIKKMVLMK